MTLSTQGRGSLKMDFFLFTGCVEVWKLSREKHSTLKHTSMKITKIPPRVQPVSWKSPSLLPLYPLLSLLVPVEFMLKTVWFHTVVFGTLLYNNINEHIETCGRVKHHTGQCPNRLKINLASPWNPGPAKAQVGSLWMALAEHLEKAQEGAFKECE